MLRKLSVFLVLTLVMGCFFSSSTFAATHTVSIGYTSISDHSSSYVSAYADAYVKTIYISSGDIVKFYIGCSFDDQWDGGYSDPLYDSLVWTGFYLSGVEHAKDPTIDYDDQNDDEYKELSWERRFTETTEYTVDVVAQYVPGLYGHTCGTVSDTDRGSIRIVVQ